MFTHCNKILYAAVATHIANGDCTISVDHIYIMLEKDLKYCCELQKISYIFFLSQEQGSYYSMCVLN